MKKLIIVPAFSILGLLIGAIITVRLERFIPTCGEDCAVQKLGLSLSWTIGTALVFAVIALFLPGQAGIRQWTFRAGVMSVAALALGVGFYVVNLQNENEYLYSIREIQPSTDFPVPVVAKADIQVFEGDSGQLKKSYTVKQWERCAIGHTDSDTHLSEIHCRSGHGLVKKDDMKNLIELPPG